MKGAAIDPRDVQADFLNHGMVVVAGKRYAQRFRLVMLDVARKPNGLLSYNGNIVSAGAPRRRRPTRKAAKA